MSRLSKDEYFPPDTSLFFSMNSSRLMSLEKTIDMA